MEIIIAEGHGFVASIIKKTLDEPFSHAAIRYGGERNRWLIHSTIGGVQPEWWFYFKDHYTHLQRYECLFLEAELAADNLTKRIGHKKYGYLTVGGAYFEIILGKIGIKIKNPFPNPNSFTCSEVIPEYFIECNKLNPNLQIVGRDGSGEYSESITPPQIRDYLASRPDLFKKIAAHSN